MRARRRRPAFRLWVSRAGLRLLALTTVALLGLGLVGATPALASITVQEGSLTLGQSTTFTTVAGDLHVYRVVVLAAQRLTLTATGGAVTSSVSVIDDATNRQVALSGLSADPTRAPQFLDVNPATFDRTLRVQFLNYTGGTLVFTPNVTVDPAPVPLAWATPTTATVAVPGEQAQLTFAAVPGHRLGVTVTGSTFAPGAVRASITFPGGGPLDLVIGGPTTPGPTLSAGTVVLTVDGVGQATGSVIVGIEDVTDVSSTAGLGALVMADLATVWTQATQPYDQVPGARLRLEVISSTLRHADGTPGSAMVTSNYRVNGFNLHPFVAAIADQPLTAVVDAPMADASRRTLTIESDGRSTGVISYRLSAQPDNPPVPAVLGAPILVDLSTAYNSRTYTFDAPANQRFLVELTAVSLTSVAPVANPVLQVTASNATSAVPVPVASLFAGQTQASAVLDGLSAPATWSLLIDPAGDTVGSVTLLITPIVDVVVPMTLGATATGSLPSGSDTMLFTYPGQAGASLPVLTIAGVDLVNGGAPGGAQLTFEQEGLGYGGIFFAYTDSPGNSGTGYTFQAPSDLDPARPWRLKAVSSPGTSGSLSLTLLAPTVTTKTVVPEAVTPVAFRGVADSTQLTFTAKAGQRIVVERLRRTTGIDLELRTAAGAPAGPAANDPDYAEFPAPTTTQQLVLVVTLSSVTPYIGGADVVIHLIADPVIPAKGATKVAWTLGQNPRLTFQGKAGMHVTLTVAPSTWEPFWQPVTATLVGPDGLPIGYSTAVYNGGTYFSDFEVPLSASGTYSIVFDPNADVIGSLTATVRMVMDVRRSVTLGAQTVIQLQQPGQRAYLSVTVPAGKQLSWTADVGVVNATLALVAPDGTLLSSGYLTSAGTFATGPLAKSTYTVVVDPFDTSVGTVRLRISASSVA